VETSVSRPLTAVAAVLNHPAEARRLRSDLLSGRIAADVGGKPATGAQFNIVLDTVEAFKVGYEIGTWLDEQFALSDKLSDWLVDTLE
jgi:hypothetical protein